jgi:nucleoside-diphosphate-sugar epimerase
MILVAGATGKLGHALLELIGSRDVVAAVRSSQKLDPTYKTALLGPDGIVGALEWNNISAVINAQGISVGSNAELQKTNIDLPVALAAQAKLNGVKTFIQESSFAVHGAPALVGGSTEIAPINFYGRTKAIVEQRLLDLSDDHFRVINVRLPFMFGLRHPGLLRKMVRFATTAGFVPAGHDGSHRSMITYDDAARVLLHSTTANWQGSLHAAALTTFSPHLLASIIHQEKQLKVGIWTLPNSWTTFAKKITPQIHRRLLQSSVLDNQSNSSVEVKGLSGIEGTIREIVRSI